MTARDLHALLAHAAGGDPRPDAELVAAADPAALTTLVRRHGPLVWGTCRRMLPDPADAADAFQAVFLALATSAHRIRVPAAVGGWLHAAAVRVCLKQRRTCARRRLREKRAARPEAGVPVADAAWDAILAAVHEEIDRLPEGERTAFVLCELQGVPAGEAAVRLGWKPGTLTGRLSKARAKLLTKLSARGFAPAAGLAGVGTLTLPAEVAALGAGCVGPAACVSPAVVALSREVTAMIATKHLAAAVLLTAGLLAGVGGVVVRADGDGPPTAVRVQAPPGLRVLVPALGPLPVAVDFAVPLRGESPAAGSGPNTPAAGHARWEYDYQVQPPRRADFVSLVSNRGQAGWEFVAVVQVSDGVPMAGRGGEGGPGGMAGGGDGAGRMGGGGGNGGEAGGMGGRGMGMPGSAGEAGGMAGRVGGPEKVVNLLVFKRPAGGVAAVVPPADRPSARTYDVPPGTAGEVVKQLADHLRQVYPTAGEVHVTAVGRDQILVHAAAADLQLVGAIINAGIQIETTGKTRLLLPTPPPATVRPATERIGLPVPATVGGFQVITLKYAKAAEVAKTVRELLVSTETAGVGFVVSSHEQRNMLLYRLPGGGDPIGLEKELKKLVAELDVPAK